MVTEYVKLFPMKTATNYSKTTSALTKKLDKMLLEIEETRHGAGSEDLSPEEAQGSGWIQPLAADWPVLKAYHDKP